MKRNKVGCKKVHKVHIRIFPPFHVFEENTSLQRECNPEQPIHFTKPNQLKATTNIDAFQIHEWKILLTIESTYLIFIMFKSMIILC